MSYSSRFPGIEERLQHFTAMACSLWGQPPAGCYLCASDVAELTGIQLQPPPSRGAVHVIVVRLCASCRQAPRLQELAHLKLSEALAQRGRP